MSGEQKEKNRILILGAAGFIGTNLTLRLLAEGEQPVLFDRPEAVYSAGVREAAEKGQACLVSGSLAEAGRGGCIAQDLLEKVDTVYHLVSTTCPTNSNRNVAGEMEDNLLATIRFLDRCAAAGVGKVVFLSSGGTVYGKHQTGLCREADEAFPITSYGVQKLSIEKILYLYREMYGLDYRIVRLSNPYGPYQRPDGVQGVVTTFTYRALSGLPIEVYGDGSVVRDYIYIDDAVEGILKIARLPGNHRLYNLGRGEGRTVLDVIGAITGVLGAAPKVKWLPGRPVDVPVNVLDISRFRQDFGPFSPVSLQEGVRRLAAFFGR